MIKHLLAPVLSLLALTSMAQQKLPVIKASDKMVGIRNDQGFKAKAWSISPEQKPDVYKTTSKKVTFYTNLDSITIKVKPGKAQDFYILLNGKDSALTRVAYDTSYLDKLKLAKQYNAKDQRTVPTFTYQDATTPELVKLRETYNLDSIAGEGSEVSQMINLMHWVHRIIRHDGNSDNPESKNAAGIITICQQEKRGVNCRMMATVLNECYLAMGFKSRYITCMPKELVFNDCHVINMVYSTELKKWLWMDPTFDAYVMDEKGILLGVEEVRQRLIDSRTLILNPDANWNFEDSQTREYYLEIYMAKNLYRLECPIYSKYDNETEVKGKEIEYIQLLPLDGLNQSPQKQKQTNQEAGVTYTSYITNNPAFFWTKPE